MGEKKTPQKYMFIAVMLDRYQFLNVLFA